MPRLPTHLTWSAFPAVADCAYGILETRLLGTERLECTACERTAFAYSDGADTFRFVLDGPGRAKAPSRALARR